MRDQAVNTSIVLDATQIAIVFDRNERVFLERLQRKGIRALAKSLRVKRCGITFKELLDDAYDCGLTGSGGSIENHKLLQFAAVSGDNASDGPFNLLTLRWRIQHGNQPIPCSRVALFQGIG